MGEAPASRDEDLRTAGPRFEVTAPGPHLWGQSDTPRPGTEQQVSSRFVPFSPLRRFFLPRPLVEPVRELRGALASLSGHALARRRRGSGGAGSPAGAGFGFSYISGLWEQAFGGLGVVAERGSDSI